jgi:N-methylhydantoinase A/oxoprolinase/acetone carboxylase beta subunit
MDDSAKRRRLRIGVDVGGTNTDGVVLDPLESSPYSAIKTWHKSPTTPNPSDGIYKTISVMLESPGVEPQDVASVTIGTTHFVNAVVETDASRLAPVAVLRLCCSHSKHAPPCIDWRGDLKEVVLGHYALLKGGLEIEGHLISDIDEEEIRSQCAIIKEKGIKSIVVNGVFSPIDLFHKQETRAADIIRTEIPGCDVVCSRDVANLGFLERENAAILNASILPFARRTIRSFHEPIRRLGLSCPVFISQNDGTVLSGELALQLPIRTFSSGPTNSMRGAGFILHPKVDGDLMIVDIGGTTTDVGILQANGFPRQQAAYSDLAGVRMNFPCPDIKSIGLGGGSIVRVEDSMSIGPDSVGHNLATESIVFGGTKLTATDFAVAHNPELKVGDPSLAQAKITQAQIGTFRDLTKKKLEKIIDIMKTSPGDVPVVLVGGGAIIAPDELQGASRVMKLQWSQVANAIGAAIARVSSVVDTVLSTESRSSSELLGEVKQSAIDKTVLAGAERSSVEVVEVEVLPLQVIIVPMSL